MSQFRSMSQKLRRRDLVPIPETGPGPDSGNGTRSLVEKWDQVPGASANAMVPGALANAIDVDGDRLEQLETEPRARGEAHVMRIVDRPLVWNPNRRRVNVVNRRSDAQTIEPQRHLATIAG